METLIRFQTQLRCPDTGRRLGLFHSAGQLEDRKDLDPALRWELGEILQWFNHGLNVPTLDGHGWRCLFWFRSSAGELTARAWHLVALLEHEGVYVEKLRTDRPGMIVYEDSHQVAAVPPRRNRRRNRFRQRALRV